MLAVAACGAEEASTRAERADSSIGGSTTTATTTSTATATTNPSTTATATTNPSTTATATTNPSTTSTVTTNATSTSTSGAGGAGGGGPEAGTATDASGGSAGDGGMPPVSCGYNNSGRVARIGADIELCLPPVVCSPNETCLPGLGSCIGGKCVYQPGYAGLETLPQAWATEYCDLGAGQCNGIWHAIDNTPLMVAQAVGSKLNLPLCGAAASAPICVGIMAPPPVMVGNSQRTIDPLTGKPVALWGLGTTWASGLCYQITGAAGSAIVAVTDRCGGYCSCKPAGGGPASSYQECSACIDATAQGEVTPECTCVGNAPPLYGQCCGRGCPTTSQNGFCDWCAASNHPHFDLDDATFLHVCGPDGPMYGSCQLASAHFVRCYDALAVWPPK